MTVESGRIVPVRVQKAQAGQREAGATPITEQDVDDAVACTAVMRVVL